MWKRFTFILGLFVCLVVWQSVFLVSKTASSLNDNASVVANDVPTSIIAKGVNNKQKPLEPKKKLLPISKLIHVGKFGAGHRLSRISTAYHLAKLLNLTRIKFQWNTCGSQPSAGSPIFPYLFGNDTWEIGTNSTKKSALRGKDVLVRNDIYGYVSGQALKNHHVPLPSHYLQSDGPFLSKLKSDKEFYQELESRYSFRHEVYDFMQQHDFDNHFVIGIHLRAGNGEQNHFVENGRVISNETEFVSNLVTSIGYFVRNTRNEYPDRFESKPPLLFLATDTAYLIDLFVTSARQRFGLPTVLFPQHRLGKNEGVTFSALQGAGDKCLDGWHAMFNDMFLLGHVNVLIASQKSTFTQTLPMSLLFDRTCNGFGPHFCEVSRNATKMSCYQDLESWLFRDNEEKTYSYTTNGPVELVLHKLVLLLPDPIPAKDFPDLENFLLKDHTSNTLLTHTYGSKPYYQKYRKASDNSLQPRFNIIQS